jgi:putative inorganic carbon (HCO3(-)) transporter
MAMLRNTPWILGLATVLSSLSWAIWRRNRASRRLSDLLGAPACQVWLQTSFALICGGLVLTSRALLERLLWFLLLLWCLARAVSALGNLKKAPQGEARVEHVETCAAKNRRGGSLYRVAHWLVCVEPALVMIVAPFLLFPNRLTPWLLFLLALPWLARKLVHGCFTAPTPMDGPILVLACMLPVSLYISLDVERSMPKLYGIVLGLAVFYAIVNHVRKPSQAWCVGLGIVALGMAVSLLALLGTEWRATGALSLPPAFGSVGRLLADMGGSLSGGFNPNQVGAALTLLLPFATSLFVLGRSSVRGTVNDPLTPLGILCRLSLSRGWIWLSLSLFSVILMMATLALTGSRAAVLGTGVALFLLLSFWRVQSRLTLLVVMIAALSVIVCQGPQQMLHSMLVVGELGSIAGRTELWQRALYMIQDFPYTGVGLNIYSLTANSLYPLLTSSPEHVLRLTHAHNVFLQIAVDVGLPGLAAYLGILIAFGAAWGLCYPRLEHGPLRALTVGVLCSMVAYHVYGLFDCLTLGAKPGVLLWMMWGLMAALLNMCVPYVSVQSESRT